MARGRHNVIALGREGGDASGADVLVVAVPSESVAGALAAVTGLKGQVTIDATNAITGRNDAFPSIAHEIKSVVGGPTAKAFNLNFASLYAHAAEQRVRPSNLYASENGASAVVAQLVGDAGYDPVSVGGLDQARALEEHAALAFAVHEGGLGPYFYRYAMPGEL